MLGTQCKIKSTPRESCIQPPNPVAELLGWTTCMVHGPRRCTCNVYNALRYRHGAKQPDIWLDVAEFLTDFSVGIDSLRAAYCFHRYRNRLVWLAKWTISKMMSILDSERRHLRAPDRVKAMIKMEIYHALFTKARLIQFYFNLSTQAMFGPEFAALQEVIAHHFRLCQLPGDITVTFACGMNPEQIAAWMDVVARDSFCYYERDGKNWDSTMRHEHAEAKYAIYDLLDPDLSRFARSCENVKGLSVCPDGVVRYSMQATVKSGHNDTTLGNSILNALIAYTAMRRHGYRGHIIVVGDDLLVASPDDIDCEAMIETERGLGIKPEARVFYDAEDTTFVSGLFARCADGFRFIPTPGRLLCRLWWTTSVIGRGKEPAYRNGVARGLRAATSDIPVLRVFIGSHDDGTASMRSNKSFLFQGSQAAAADLRPWFSRRYGLYQDSIESCESWLQRLPVAPLFLKHYVLDRIMARDLADIADREAMPRAIHCKVFQTISDDATEN